MNDMDCRNFYLHLMISAKSFLVLVAYHYCKKVDSSHVHT